MSDYTFDLKELPPVDSITGKCTIHIDDTARRCETCAKFRPQEGDMPTDFCLDIGYVAYGAGFSCNRWAVE